ncbi:MAG: hypothetical protein M1820_002197 [Bogoriella megaspora]|nr:MAG: hypothetical protein M1820_002197 [Bogoriella megaspora]
MKQPHPFPERDLIATVAGYKRISTPQPTGDDPALRQGPTRLWQPCSRYKRETGTGYIGGQYDSDVLTEDQRFQRTIFKNGWYYVCESCVGTGPTCVDRKHNLVEIGPRPEVAIDDAVRNESLLPCIGCYQSHDYLSEIHQCAICHSKNADLDPIYECSFAEREVQAPPDLLTPIKKRQTLDLNCNADMDTCTSIDDEPESCLQSTNESIEWMEHQNDMQNLCIHCRQICSTSLILNDQTRWQDREAHHSGSSSPLLKAEVDRIPKRYEHHQHHDSALQLMRSAMEGCPICAHLARSLRTVDKDKLSQEVVVGEQKIREAMDAAFKAGNTPLTQAAVVGALDSRDRKSSSSLRISDASEKCRPSEHSEEWI